MSPMAAAPDPFRLLRFVEAQAECYAQALAELREGAKRTHWMWFIFPQLAGLGRSSTAQFYAIRGREEARAYLAHPVLGPRLLECTRAVLEAHTTTGRSARAMLGAPDDLKLRSCMTLFAAVADDPAPFREVLLLLFDSAPDATTLDLLNG